MGLLYLFLEIFHLLPHRKQDVDTLNGLANGSDWGTNPFFFVKII